ncbi:MAG: hypothetical protein LBG52_05700 [Candidatus Peribacteria bacterium]|nr:hypothetical protein [Candidatus Peribacteria bacterium]
MAQANGQKPDIFVRPAQDSVYQRTPEQLGHFRTLITEKFPQITDLDDERFEQHKDNLYKFEWIIN